VNVAILAADECHPQPDQLHPCSRFFRFSSIGSCDATGAEKIDAFHDAFDRFSGGKLFLRARSIRSRSPFSLRLSRFRHPPPGFAPPFRVVGVNMGEGPRSVCPSSREGDASAAIRIGFPGCVLELSSIFRQVPASPPYPEKTLLFRSPQVGRVPLARGCTALPRRAEPPPTRSFAPRFVGVGESRFVPFRVASKKRGCNANIKFCNT